MHTYLHTYIHAAYILMHACIYIYICVCVYIYIYKYVYILRCVYLYNFVYVSLSLSPGHRGGSGPLHILSLSLRQARVSQASSPPEGFSGSGQRGKTYAGRLASVLSPSLPLPLLPSNPCIPLQRARLCQDLGTRQVELLNRPALP